jgi:non-ribosomal peptide synthetase component F
MATLLWQYGEPEEVIFGTPVSLRGTAAVDGMIGCLTNMYPLRLAVSPAASFRALVNAAKAEVLGAMEHRAVPYSAIVRMSRLETGADAPPPCDTALVVDDMHWVPFSLPEVTAENIRLPPGHAKFAVLLHLAAADDGGYEGWWEYDAEVFDAVTVARVAGQFTELLTRCVAAPDEPLGRIPDFRSPARNRRSGAADAGSGLWSLTAYLEACDG